MKTYTRTGDNGQTSLIGGERVSKNDPRVEAYGTIDELNSHIGLLSAYLQSECTHPHASHAVTQSSPRIPIHIQDTLVHIQHDLFTIGAILAGSTSHTSPSYDYLEQGIDQMTATLPPWQGFTLPGGTQAAAQCHVCRTVCRRAERLIIGIRPTDDPVLAYLNRMSDYLYILALEINRLADHRETLWKRS